MLKRTNFLRQSSPRGSSRMIRVLRLITSIFLVDFVSGLPRLVPDGFASSAKPGTDGSSSVFDVEEFFFDQRLDHFDRQESRTFRQRYFINKRCAFSRECFWRDSRVYNRYWAGPGSGAPVFLCVGGEGPPLTSNVLDASVHCNDMVELAPWRQALLVALEHRYYGQSNPFDDWATDSLRWLSSQQALEDLAKFRAFISEQEDLTGREKWVTWGGSYPGMLAGWARLKYPHLFHAAVSSSSPLLAQLDFPQYAEVMRDSLASESPGVGGSENCASAVETGHAEIGSLLQTEEGRLGLVRMFNLCNSTALEDESARVQFAGDGVISLPIQENDPACGMPMCNIAAICTAMMDNSLGSTVERLAFVRGVQKANIVDRFRSGLGSCEVFPPAVSWHEHHGASSLSRSLLPVPAMSTSRRELAEDPSNPDRAWIYQTCTEFGFYQTCEVGTRCPFTQGLHTLELDLRLCQRAFGITGDRVLEQVKLTNIHYGGDKPRGSRVMFPNGEIDPWHALGVLHSMGPDLPALYVSGASHHFWTHPSRSTDYPEIVRARNSIWRQVTKWLEEDDD